MDRVEVRLLQTPSVSINGKPVSFSFKRVAAVFYYMAYRKKATRAELVSLLWDDCEEAKGLKNLRQILYAIKKAFSADVIVALGREQLSLNPAMIFDCDADRLQNNDFSAETTDEFLRGFFLRDAHGFDEWVTLTRSELSHQISEQQRQTASEAIQAGQYEKAERISRCLLADNPFDEAALITQMETYCAQKRYYDVVRVFEDFKARLEEELGTTPQKETCNLYYQIMNTWAASTDQSLPQDALLPCRQKPFARLCGAYHSMTDPAVNSCSVVLRGRPGSGKSYLIAHMLEKEDFSPVCLIKRNGTTTDVFDQTLKELEKFAENHGRPLPEELKRHIQDLFMRTTLGYETDLSAYAKVLIAAARYVSETHRIVFVLENMHCLTPNGIYLLRNLIENISAKNFLVIATVRSQMPKYILDSFHALVSSRHISGIHIDFLSQEDTRLYLRQLAKCSIAENVQRLVYTESNGNLFLIQKIAEQLTGNDTEFDVLRYAKDAELQWLASISSNAFSLAALIAMFPGKVEFEQLYQIWEDQTTDLGALLAELWLWDITAAWEENNRHYYRIRCESLRSLLVDRTPYYQQYAAHQKIEAILHTESKD